MRYAYSPRKGEVSILGNGVYVYKIIVGNEVKAKGYVVVFE